MRVSCPSNFTILRLVCSTFATGPTKDFEWTVIYLNDTVGLLNVKYPSHLALFWNSVPTVMSPYPRWLWTVGDNEVEQRKVRTSLFYVFSNYTYHLENHFVHTQDVKSTHF